MSIETWTLIGFYVGLAIGMVVGMGAMYAVMLEKQENLAKQGRPTDDPTP